MTIRSYLRAGAVVVGMTAAAVVVAPAVADALSPTAGDVEITFDSCGRASATFDGDVWNENGAGRMDVAGQRLSGRIEVSNRSTGERGTVVVVAPRRAPLRVEGLVRNGFVTAVGCI